MDRTMIEDLKSGDEVKQLFLLKAKVLRSARNNSLFMQLDLGDRTGMLPGRMWDAKQELFDSFQPDDFVLVKGRVETYQNKLQLVVHFIEPRPESEADIADFIPTTNKDIDEMYGRIIEVAKTVKHAGLRKLLASFLKDEEIAAKFKRCPGGKHNHHAFIGGLLEHTLAMSEMALKALDVHPDLDGDMLICGVILHDIGKIDELAYERSFSYTDSGELLGHLYIGARMIEERSAGIPEMTPQDVKLLSHLILSHHGEYAYQSPKLPMTAEAFVIHFLDNLDAKVNAFRGAMLKDRDSESRWTEYNRMFERRLFKGFGPSD